MLILTKSLKFKQGLFALVSFLYCLSFSLNLKYERIFFVI